MKIILINYYQLNKVKYEQIIKILFNFNCSQLIFVYNIIS